MERASEQRDSCDGCNAYNFFDRCINRFGFWQSDGLYLQFTILKVQDFR